jgi:hypothetical protein
LKIWANLEDDIYKLPPIRESDIKRAENLFNVKLPKSYLDILRIQNGGSIIFNAHPSPKPTSWSDHSVNVDFIMGIGENNGILETPYYIKEWNMPEGLILISGQGHSWIAFDYRNTVENPSIVYIDNETEEIFKIADSFESFLKNLYVEEMEEEIEFGEFNEIEISKESTMRAIYNNDIHGIITSVDLMSQEVKAEDLEWFSSILLQLSKHPNDDIRISVAEATNFLLDSLEKNTVEKLIEIFNQDNNEDVRYFAKMIRDQI